MEFLLILAVVLAINTVGVISILLAQDTDANLPVRHSLIPGTNQKFLYIQDFWTMTWGDLYGVPLFVNAFVHLVKREIIYLWWAIPIGAVVTLGFLVMCLGKNHKPDYGFPATGKISLAGKLHLFYFGMGWGAGLVALWSLFVTGDSPLDIIAWVGLAGAGFYLACFGAEFASGNFDQLKKLEEQKVS